MNFKFIIDKNYLLLKMISNRNNIEELNIWKNNIVANILDNSIIEEIESKKDIIEEYFINGEFKQLLLNDNFTAKILKIINDDLYIKYYNESLKYLNLIKNNWIKLKNKINKWLEETIKINFSQKTTIVYISHPKLNTGKCVNQKYIFWGHYKGITDINYNIVYLCHENLHVLLPNKNCLPPAMKLYYDKKDNISNQEHWKKLNETIENYYKIYDFECDVIHTIIELICDNELYTILSLNSKYKEGHNNPNYSLVKYKELILPYWFQYLALSSIEIKKRVPNFIDRKNKLLEKNDILNIENFIIFLINNINIRNKLEIPNLTHKNKSK